MTDESMVERVARAMWECARDTDHAEWSDLSPLYRESMGKYARAAIAALREPTEAMCVAGTEQWLCEATTEDRSEVNWRAMIDEALR